MMNQKFMGGLLTVIVALSGMAGSASAYSGGEFKTSDTWLHSKMAESAVQVSSGKSKRLVEPRIDKLTLTMAPGVTGAFSGLSWDDGFYWTQTDDAGAGPNHVVTLAKLKVTPASAEVIETIALRDEQGALVTGSTLDPEDITVAPDGTLWMSDELYPVLIQVSPTGQILRRVSPPGRFRYRVKGRGFEGLTISPDGRTLYTILQTGLSTEPDPTHTWLLSYDIENGTFKEYPYYLDKPSLYTYPAGAKPFIGANGLAMVGPNQLLVIERDNQSGANVRHKKVYWVTVPENPTGTPLEKRLIVDLAAMGYDLEKVEGIAVPHPNTMLLVNDNDADPNKPTVIWYLQW